MWQKDRRKKRIAWVWVWIALYYKGDFVHDASFCTPYKQEIRNILTLHYIKFFRKTFKQKKENVKK